MMQCCGPWKTVLPLVLPLLPLPPDAVCTRAQIVTFLWRSQSTPSADVLNPFADVAVDAYYNKPVLWAVENGITAGTSATTFSPNAECTLAQIGTVLYRSKQELKS